jgi:DNA-directed RNA polymerase specialized sigma24 family protein
MTVDPDVLQRAKKGNRAAIIEILSAQYSSSHRMAHAITGREDVGTGIVTHVMKQGVRVLQSWQDEDAPQRWFRHHILLTTRRAARWKPDPSTDTLTRARDADAPYLAFIRALRSLPHQQVEAFLLHHGERFDLRDLAVSMDCSTTAAKMHLQQADEQLKGLAGADFDALIEKLRGAYDALTPTRDLSLGRVATDLRRRFLWLRLRRIARILIITAMVAGLGWLTWFAWPQIHTMLRSILSRFGLT